MWWIEIFEVKDNFSHRDYKNEMLIRNVEQTVKKKRKTKITETVLSKLAFAHSHSLFLLSTPCILYPSHPKELVIANTCLSIPVWLHKKRSLELFFLASAFSFFTVQLRGLSLTSPLPRVLSISDLTLPLFPQHLRHIFICTFPIVRTVVIVWVNTCLSLPLTWTLKAKTVICTCNPCT